MQLHCVTETDKNMHDKNKPSNSCKPSCEQLGLGQDVIGIAATGTEIHDYESHWAPEQS